MRQTFITAIGITVAAVLTFGFIVSGAAGDGKHTFFKNETRDRLDALEVTVVEQAADIATLRSDLDAIADVVADLSMPDPTAEPTPEPIVFSNINVVEVGPDYAVIEWNVSPAAQGWIEYGTDTTYGSETTHELGLLDYHRQAVRGLEPETEYHFRVIAYVPATDTAPEMIAYANV